MDVTDKISRNVKQDFASAASAKTPRSQENALPYDHPVGLGIGPHDSAGGGVSFMSGVPAVGSIQLSLGSRTLRTVTEKKKRDVISEVPLYRVSKESNQEDKAGPLTR